MIEIYFNDCESLIELVARYYWYKEKVSNEDCEFLDYLFTQQIERNKEFFGLEESK